MNYTSTNKKSLMRKCEVDSTMNFLNEFLGLVIPMMISIVTTTVTILISFMLGRHSTEISRKKEMKLKRYEELYAPVMAEILKVGNLDEPIRDKSKYQEILNIIMRNSHLLGKRTARKLLSWSTETLVLGYETVDEEQKKFRYPDNKDFFEDNYNKAVKNFLHSFLLEAQQLSEALKLPNLAGAILNWYDWYQEQKI